MYRFDSDFMPVLRMLQPNRVVRATKPDSGFISDPKSTDITCSIGNQQLPTVRPLIFTLSCPH